jgi:uncharacterized protein (TIGR03000 family)
MLPGGTPTAPGAPGAAPVAPGGSTYNEPTIKDSGLITIYVPYDAKVFVNGMATKSEGSRRQFVSYGLKPGYTYKYEIKAQIVKEGKLVSDVKTVAITAGDRGAAAFGFNAVEDVAGNP